MIGVLVFAIRKFLSAGVTKVIFIAVCASRYYFTTYIAEMVRTVYTFADCGFTNVAQMIGILVFAIRKFLSARVTKVIFITVGAS